MLSKAATARRCLYDQEYANGSHLPFLYQTRTISRRWASFEPFSQDDGQTPKRWQQRSYARRYQDGENTTRARTSKPRRHSNRGQVRDGQTERPRPIPFEGKLPSNSLVARVEGSTITPKELRTFEKLFKTKPVRPDGKLESVQDGKRAFGPTGYRLQSKRYGMPAVQVNREFPDLLRPLAEEAAAMRERASVEDDPRTIQENAISATKQDETANKELELIKSKMDKAQTDATLWKVLQDQVFKNIRQLPEYSDKAQSGQNFQTLSHTLPQSLLHFMKLIRSSFPGSSLGLVLLPTLKKLGPSAFALGASTELFNEYMWLLYKHYADLDSIDQTLSEMEKNVYEFDSGTKDLITTILHDARKALNNNYGPGMQALWSTDRKTRGLEKLRRWDGIVEERVKAAALKAAREKQTEFVEEGEDEGDQKLAEA